MLLYAKLKKIVIWCASTECAVVLFLGIALLAIPGTFTESRAIYVSPFFLSLLGAFGLNLILCTIRRIKSISKPVLILHGGVIATLVGCILTSFGYVATVNLYEGTTVEQLYRWDEDKDVNIGVELGVKKVHREFWPVPVKVGVLHGLQKEQLFVSKTGESFQFRNYRIYIDAFDPQSESLNLVVFEGARRLGTCSTSGMRDLPPDFPYSFALVAFQTPSLKRQWVDLELFRNSEKVASGISEVNNPFRWEGLYFYNTQITRSPNGVYAGIQVVRDPGRPYVFAGFTVMAIGSVLAFARRFFRKSPAKAI
ncbi:cytochrome c biogenesis protein ResB [Pelotalea chapellei]|uniref:ResB-like family cytochrome C biogenesis protein n=1 Tax=Pelotalea chapellei TaxID=44671 RepID=A0ABS5UA31_9BACT|nr:cytochrome c biogenesis protein ResB [Pelotalea chapellei]MBT1072515.1 ResB-like family cytochrome C biogenesis protein [Pelotalea chapellei]